MTRIQVGDWAALSALSALAILSISAATIALAAVTLIGAARRRFRDRAACPDAVIESLAAPALEGTEGACILFELDDTAIHAKTIVELIRGVARADDLVTRTSATRIALIARGIKREVDLAALACRCQAAVEDLTGGASLCAGLALSRRGVPVDAVYSAAEQALTVAIARGPGQMEMTNANTTPGCRIETPETSPMLETWIEPRIDAVSLRVSAIAPIARWRHPALGLLDSREVLVAVMRDEARAVLFLRLLEDGLATLARLESAGHLVPILSLPMPSGVARTSGIAARIAFALDRADIAPERLELRLSGSISAADLTGIGRIGCRIAATPEIVETLPDTFGPTTPGIVLDTAALHHDFRGGYEPGQLVAALEIDDPAAAARLAALGATDLQGSAIAEPQRISEIANWLSCRTRATESRRAVGR